MPYKPLVTLLLLALVFCGCEYNVPLVDEATVAIDPTLVGVWEPVREQDEEAKSEEKLVILSFSKTEYMIIHPTGKDEMYFRVYPVTIDGLKLVQLQWLGYQQHALKGTEKPYQLCRYRLDQDILTIQVLNGKVLDREAETSEALRQSLLENKSNPELFQDPGRFRKLKP